LKRNSLVLALSRNSTTEYQLAKIIEIRPQKTGNEEDAQLDKMLLGDKLPSAATTTPVINKPADNKPSTTSEQVNNTSAATENGNQLQ
jgi:hypothetical protein